MKLKIFGVTINTGNLECGCRDFCDCSDYYLRDEKGFKKYTKNVECLGAFRVCPVCKALTKNRVPCQYCGDMKGGNNPY